MYGQSSFGLSQTLHINRNDAKEYITAYFQKFCRVKAYLDELKELASERMYTETMFGRKRYLPEIRSSDKRVRAMAERMAINTPIQGTAADMIKLAMIRIQEQISRRSLYSRLILQVHDELILEVLPSEFEELKLIVLQQMEQVVSLKIPLKVDWCHGLNWLEMN